MIKLCKIIPQIKIWGIIILHISMWSVSFSPAAYAVDGTALDPSRSLFSARQLGVGGASIAFSDDAAGVFANPAGLTHFEFPQLLGASRKLLLDETQYTLLGWAVPTHWGTFGVGYTGMNMGGSIPTKRDPATNRIIIDPSREATSYENSVFALSYSRKLRDNLSLGGNLKIFNQSLSGDISSKASAMGIDLSALFKPLSWLSIGANLQNILEGNLQWQGGASDKIGGFYKLGCKLNILGSSQEALRTYSQPLYGGIDIDVPHGTLSSTSYHLGLEYFPQEKIALRTGYSPDGLALGIGLINGGFRFDYAYAQRSGIPGDTPHYFTLSYIGERVFSTRYKFKKKEPWVKFIQPQDHFITDQDTIAITAEGQLKKIQEKKRVWTVTAISETFEVEEIMEFERLALNPIYFNGNKIDQIGTIETSSPAGMGRNIYQIVGYTSPEANVASGEVKVLRIAPFSDTPMTHWAIEPIALSVTLGLVKGYPNNTFQPEKGISRAELVTLLVRTMPVREEELLEFSEFGDVPSTLWSAKYIAYSAEKGLVSGYPDKSFKPNKVLSRAEGITILMRYAQLSEEAGAPALFPDLKSDYWANKYIAPAKKAGLLKYLEGKDFNPSAPFTRAEACEVLYRTAQIQSRIDQFWETGIVSAEHPITKPAEPKVEITLPSTIEAAPLTAPPTSETQP